MKRKNLSLLFMVAYHIIGIPLSVYSQSLNPTIKLDSVLLNMAHVQFESEQHPKKTPPAFVRDLCREALLSYDLPQDADTILVLCDTYNLIGTGSRHVDICTEKGGYASYVKSVSDNQLQPFPQRTKWAKPRLEYLLGIIRSGGYACLSDDSNYINSFTDHWTRLYFCFFDKIGDEFFLCYYQEMGQDIREVYQRELAELER